MGANRISEEERRRRFWSRVKKKEGCWLWAAGKSGNGYGQVKVGPKMVGAHVYSYQISCGLTNGRQVLHTCDNALCVRPDHLFLGTQQDNMTDKVKKGRQARGVANGNARHDDNTLRSLIKDHLETAAGPTELASRHPVSVSYAHAIIRGYGRGASLLEEVRAALAGPRGPRRT